MFATFILLSACSNDDDSPKTTTPDLIGEWALIEIYADPGDGSGTFMAVESDKFVKFGADNNISSNGSLCSMSTETDSPSEGTYSAQSQTFVIADCGIVIQTASFEIVGQNLIISYPCIEACQEKYVKVE